MCKGMDEVKEAFSKIEVIDFLLERLMEAADDCGDVEVVDISTALNAYLPVYVRYVEEALEGVSKTESVTL